jgi:hypothetical protein
MTTGSWYRNGRYLLDASISGAFKWGSPNGGISDVNYALYATIVNSGVYAPDPQDTYLGVAGINGVAPNTAEPTAAQCTLIRKPVQLEAVAKASKGTPTSNFVIYPADPAHPLAWTVNAPTQTLTAGWILLYWDINVANALVNPLTAYYPDGTTNNAHDATCPLIGYLPFVDSQSLHNYWTTTSVSQQIVFTYDVSFSGSSVLLSDQVS